MISGRTRTAVKYVLLMAPTAVLAGLVILVGIGAWVAATIREPALFADAPTLIQKLTRSTYWHTRRHWHTLPECVEFDSELLYRPKSGPCVFENAEFRTTMHFDEIGARRTAAPPPGSTGPRLVIVGDSHAMGWGVEDEETFASVLASEFGYRTVNLGVSSYATPRELLRLERDFPIDAEDIIVLQYCDNDFEENRQFTARRGRRYVPEELERLQSYSRTSVSALPIAGLLLRQLTGRAIKPLRPAPVTGSDPGTDLDPTTAFITSIDASSALDNRRVLAVAINSYGRKTHLDADTLARAGIPLIEPELAAEDFFAIDDHMRPSGHRKVAQTIAERIPALAARNPADPIE